MGQLRDRLAVGMRLRDLSLGEDPSRLTLRAASGEERFGAIFCLFLLVAALMHLSGCVQRTATGSGPPTETSPPVYVSPRVHAQVDTSAVNRVCVSAEEENLYDLIMAYRKQKKLPAVPLSKSLTYVAQAHVRDLMEHHPDTGDCTVHSWSDQGLWKPCCYYSDHRNAALMWSKPGELTAYPGKGYEIGCSSTGVLTAADTMDTWKASRFHNAVIINKEVWMDFAWTSVGVAIYGRYSVAWFGTEPDPVGVAPVCGEVGPSTSSHGTEIRRPG